MTIKLSLLAIVMLRMLYEIRNSKAAFSMLVVAWLAIAISTVLNTQWAQHRIGSQELAMAYPNAVLVATISLMLAHLLYVRFVYLHAHGAIAVKKRVATQENVRPARASKEAKAKPATRSAAAEKKPSVSTAKADHEAVAQTSKRSRKKASKATPVVQPAEKSAPAKVTSPHPQSSSKPAKNKAATMSDFQALLKKKQAQKAAAGKDAGQDSASDPPLASTRDDDNEAVIKMSKSERRRARKAAKRRAA